MLKTKALLAAGVVGSMLALAGCSDAGTDELGFGEGLPTAYPLMPGDAELWRTMNAAERQRALRFLQEGSTIRSSLKPDA